MDKGSKELQKILDSLNNMSTEDYMKVYEDEKAMQEATIIITDSKVLDKLRKQNEISVGYTIDIK